MAARGKMSFQSALSRLRNHEGQSRTSSQKQTLHISEENKKVVGQGSGVFTLEDTESDIFDIDNDIFSSADVILTSLTEGSNPATNLNPLHSSTATSTQQTSTSSTATPVTKQSSRTYTFMKHSSNTHKVSVAKSFTPSPSSLEKLKSLAYTKRQPAQKRSGSSSEVNPPAKRVSVNVSVAEGEEGCGEEELFDEKLLAAFISEPDEEDTASLTDQPSRQLPHRPSTPGLSTGMPSTGNFCQSSFIAPSSHPRRSSRNCASNSVASLTNFTGQSSQGAHTPLTPSTPQSQSTSISTRMQSTSSVARPTPKSSSLHIPSSTPKSTISRSRSVLATPQNVAPVRRRFPGPAGILPALAIGQSLDGIVIRTPSIPTPASTPQVKTGLIVSSKLHPTSSQLSVFSPAPKKHYLSITPDNIVVIYPSSTTTNTTSPTAHRTICLTEIERRYEDQVAKENSQQNTLRLSLPQPQLSTTDTHHLSLPQPQDTHHLSLPQPQLSSTDTEAPAPVSVQQVTASSQRVQQAYPGPLSPPDHLSRERSASQPPQNQETGSFFSNQLCEDEFDSIMACLDSGFDF